jgi:hypothetical protein
MIDNEANLLQSSGSQRGVWVCLVMHRCRVESERARQGVIKKAMEFRHTGQPTQTGIEDGMNAWR